MKLPIKALIASAAVVIGLTGCNGKKASTSKNDRETNAIATYVAPGEKDEYYLFYSGGHSGQVFVAGIPSMRHISTIPVFAEYPATGYGFDDKTKAMMGGFNWGDASSGAFADGLEIRRALALRE